MPLVIRKEGPAGSFVTSRSIPGSSPGRVFEHTMKIIASLIVTLIYAIVWIPMVVATGFTGAIFGAIIGGYYVAREIAQYLNREYRKWAKKLL